MGSDVRQELVPSMIPAPDSLVLKDRALGLRPSAGKDDGLVRHRDVGLIPLRCGQQTLEKV